MTHNHTPSDPRIFVFGSNLQGIHGGGAARYAHTSLGALWGQGEGLMGRSYALPTCSWPGEPLPLSLVEKHVNRFLGFAQGHPHMTFFVSAVGCGLAGFTEEQVSPFFAKASANCDLPKGWRS